jgi:replicative DNA helicase
MGYPLMTFTKTRPLLTREALNEGEVRETVELSQHIKGLAEKLEVTEFQLMVASVSVVMEMVNRQADPSERGAMVQEVFEHMWEAAGLLRD